jgi:protein associated with RNAse G/E
VVVCKFDGAEHRRWSARLIEKVDSLIVLDAKFEEHIEHDLLGTIPIGTLSTEYYWLDRWYNVFRFRDADLNLKRFYCNINMPPRFDGQTLTYVDLDIDVLVEPDLSYRVLDLEDFQENARQYNYPVEIQTAAHRALDELIGLIETRAFPFEVS